MSDQQIQLMHGECLELMALIPDGSVDAIICDLPFGTTQNSWDVVIPFAPMWEAYNRVVKPNGAIVLNAADPFTVDLISSNRKSFRYRWVWDKCRPTGFLNAEKQPLRVTEDICVFYARQCTFNPQKETRGRPRNKGSYNKPGGSDNYGAFNRQAARIRPHVPFRDAEPLAVGENGEGCLVIGAALSLVAPDEGRGQDRNTQAFNNVHFPTNILRFSNAAQKGKLHTTQKPVALFEYLIQTYTNPGDLVLDNCMGSGTTAVACIQSGRRFIGIEKDDKYFAVAQQRIRDTHRNLFFQEEAAL